MPFLGAPQQPFFPPQQAMMPQAMAPQMMQQPFAPPQFAPQQIAPQQFAPPQMASQQLVPQHMVPPAPVPQQARQSAPPPQFQPPAPQMPTTAEMAMGLASDTVSRPTVRMHAPEAPKAPVEVRKIVLPTPEELGVKFQPAAVERQQPLVKANEVNWDDLRARLKKIGALSFRVDRAEEGGFRAVFLLPGTASDYQLVEAVGATEAAALQTALRQAETWSLTRR